MVMEVTRLDCVMLYRCATLTDLKAKELVVNLLNFFFLSFIESIKEQMREEVWNKNERAINRLQIINAATISFCDAI